MEDRENYRPFTGDSDTHLRLSEPSLVMVLCQIRWPQLGQWRDHFSEAVTAFAHAVAED